MNKYRHILLAADLSGENSNASQRAQQLAACFGAKLSLVHVVEYLPMDYGGDQIYPMDLELDLEDKLVSRAREELQRLGKALGVAPSDQHVVVGAAKIEILRIAEEHGVDLILVGSHGRRGLALLLGSTANAVLHRANCDVLAVRVADG
jgi:universal stress protein A